MIKRKLSYSQAANFEQSIFDFKYFSSKRQYEKDNTLKVPKIVSQAKKRGPTDLLIVFEQFAVKNEIER